MNIVHQLIKQILMDVNIFLNIVHILSLKGCRQVPGIDAREVTAHEILSQTFRVRVGDMAKIAALRQCTNAVDPSPDDRRNPPCRPGLIGRKYRAQNPNR
jgi:hypothetical protein